MGKKDLKLGRFTHDLSIDKFDLSLIDKSDRIIQQIKIRVHFFFSEWFLNTMAGIPYYQDVVVKNADIARVEAVFKEAIMTTPDVLELLSFSMDFDAKLRKLAINFRVRSTYGIIEGKEGVVV